MQISHTVTAYSNDDYKQEIQIDVEFNDREVAEVIEVNAYNFIQGNLHTVVSIKEFLESQNLMDTLLESINWSEIYADTKHELIHESSNQ